MTKIKVLIIDYELGNLSSVFNAIQKLGYKPKISSNREDIHSADAYILPGVGAFGEAMSNINRLGFIDTLKEQVLIRKKPLLGICLGMQILAKDSQESGFNKGLGWVNGHVIALKSDNDFKVPHVGWNDIKVIRESPLFLNIPMTELNFYFDHSFYISGEEEHVSSTCFHKEAVTTSIQVENIFGTQFHPEKSQNNGLRILRNFLNLAEESAKNTKNMEQ
ncbi:MAG: imidazole glycerol phosphate synthase subunit HisH [Nanoarchaeota archaeon]